MYLQTLLPGTCHLDLSSYVVFSEHPFFPFIYLFSYNLELYISFLVYSSVSFDKCMKSCNYHHSQDREQILYPQKFTVPHCQPLLLLCAPRNHWPVFCSYIFSFFRMSYVWNNICSLLSLSWVSILHHLHNVALQFTLHHCAILFYFCYSTYYSLNTSFYLFMCLLSTFFPLSWNSYICDTFVQIRFFFSDLPSIHALKQNLAFKAISRQKIIWSPQPSEWAGQHSIYI